MLVASVGVRHERIGPMSNRKSTPRCRQCNGTTNPAEPVCRTCQYSPLVKRLETIGARLVSFDTGADAPVTLCVSCIALREPHVTRAIGDGTIRQLAPLCGPCIHCGARR